MNMQQKSPKKNMLKAAKLAIATASITSLFGLWNLFSKEDNNAAANLETEPTDSLEEQMLNAPLPTLAPSVLNQSQSSQASQNITQVTPPPAEPTLEPVIERVVVGSSGGSGGSSSTRTSSSR